MFEGWLEKLRGLGIGRRLAEHLAVLCQYTVTAWQVILRMLRFVLRGVVRRVRPAG